LDVNSFIKILKKYKLIYFFVLISLFLFNLLIFITPFLSSLGFSELANGLYFGFSFTCHQLNSRSLCLFENSIEDCTPNSSKLELKKSVIVEKENKIGYKFPVCSRDIGIYFSMLLGVIVWGIKNKKNLLSSHIPNRLYFFLVLLPLAIDGTAQLFGFWESSNLIRLLTGGLVGFFAGYFIVPLLNNFFVR
jgi:uncharacterized membrane protein